MLWTIFTMDLYIYIYTGPWFSRKKTPKRRSWKEIGRVSARPR